MSDVLSYGRIIGPSTSRGWIYGTIRETVCPGWKRNFRLNGEERFHAGFQVYPVNGVLAVEFI